MLIIISDLHLGDGTCGHSISSDAFYVFAERLDEMAMRASWRKDGSYRPIKKIEIILLGDILDPLHSTLWLDTKLDTPKYTRPWTDQKKPAYAEKLKEITRAILKENADAVQVLQELEVEIPRKLASQRGWEESKDLIKIETHLHYMIGNHDWYYGIPGTPFDEIRAEVVEALGLSQDSSPFPYRPEDNDDLAKNLAAYKVYALHGDCYDKFNYDAKKGRINSALGDVFTIEMLNRFPLEVEKRLPSVPPEMIDNLREISHVRPALATWLWVSSQIKHNNLPNSMQDKIKQLWEQIGGDFLKLEVVRDADEIFKFDIVDQLEIALQISKRTPVKTINDLLLWIQEKFWGGEISYAKKALDEPAFINKDALYIVYGHTHHHEVVPLDTSESRTRYDDQLYFNAGTWHTYFDLAIHKPYEQKFVPYQVVSYLAFYKDDQRRGHRFETLSGIFS
ncbi:MAG: hypothetical protein HN736_13745 [Anaerolineae bacterium]|jgi:UDP-2,3-diacylglucosamine pyrophosphatase LpxH|nr:hypothetical protein [Anaerolineae bacterium]MBT4309959.1 hypothetical protein [Anaerolineae bacterium]MBT4458459.1 hypothetical protein [Anaerolineae bacterium]MBT4841059.1 hypothetical protein [Anaerolineae bacterium]MBT6062240.1 hypothetical protein [Anaerolineae bacterium]